MVEAASLTGLWRSPEWKKRSRAYTEGKACEWCGARAGDKYTDSKGKTRTLGLAPHHIEKHKWGLPLYNQVRDRLYRQWLKGHDLGEAPRGLSERERRSYLKHQWARVSESILSVFTRALAMAFTSFGWASFTLCPELSNWSYMGCQQ
ncbi:MAG: hypothetical protein V1924_06475 [Candidatus Bathyarchaeota archaeon]